ncbi:ABC transporter ATP-binding protein [Humibacillus sp. DSM 29435]|uniref:ABC transporter ATP-binding protein n=1 Tax=Humibacillus sp. DSM 29435 TaxID=1869167 RepID=UPI0008723FAA|nr:ABC transporter ATP-binding protein [Humibacillus sp. DSM 29435]OFE17134.1 ABC transporter ATP-binding protein [Humibacillus sp. DSM 29435]
MSATLEIRDLYKRYGRTSALKGVSLTIEVGEVVGLIGRNGAGKTTMVEIAAGLHRADRGTVRILGLDPQRDRAALRQVLGVQLQESQLHSSLRVGELARLFRSFYRNGRDPDALLERLGLHDQRRTVFDHLSGGQQQRLSIALALVGRPRVIVLDELTTGLDPEARREVWTLVEDLRQEGVTVLLISHAMDEVERLCDRVVVLAAGRVVADDTPAGLVRTTGVPTLEDAFLQLTVAGTGLGPEAS